jgi:hypothetical protein
VLTNFSWRGESGERFLVLPSFRPARPLAFGLRLIATSLFALSFVWLSNRPTKQRVELYHYKRR